MAVVHQGLTRTFREFFDSEKAGGVLLIISTIISLIVANSILGPRYLDFWHHPFAGLTVELWVNDGLMAIFFLLIGLELVRELNVGELSDLKRAMLPIIAALGGIVVPASIHFYLNAGLPTQPGIGIPMATDIAFALGVLALLGSRVPVSLKVFLAALAVIDDLGAIIVIAIFYTAELSIAYLAGALATFAVLMLLNRMRVMRLLPYLLGGALMWFLMLKSGIHATIAGVLLAFAIPFSSPESEVEPPAKRLEHFLHKPVAFLILPIFALANTAIIIGADWAQHLATPNSSGILMGLVLGKPLGITLLSFAAIALGISRLPLDMNWRHLLGAGLLGGIGFTMSIFITNLAFPGDLETVNASKMAIMLASLVAGTLGFLWLRLFGRPVVVDADTMKLRSEA